MSRDRKRARFPETSWSLVGRAGASDAATRREAITELLVAYMPGLRNFLVLARRVPADIADDILQAFVADKLLATDFVRRADQGRGRFRNFVLKCLDNFASTRLRREFGRHGTVPLDGDVQAPTERSAVVDRFETEWVQQVVRDALRSMEAEYREMGRTDVWDVFRLRVVEPLLEDAEPVGYGDLVQRLGIATPRQAINLLATGKRGFQRHLRRAVGRYVREPDLVEQEIEDLREIIGR